MITCGYIICCCTAKSRIHKTMLNANWHDAEHKHILQFTKSIKIAPAYIPLWVDHKMSWPMLNKTTNKNDNASFGKPGGYQQHIAIPKALCNDVHVGAFQSQSNMKFERTLFSRHSLTGLDFCNHRQPSATVQSMFQMLEWITWCINEWVSDRVSEQVNGWLGGWMIDWLIDRSIDWMNEWMIDWMNEWFLKLNRFRFSDINWVQTKGFPYWSRSCESLNSSLEQNGRFRTSGSTP